MHAALLGFGAWRHAHPPAAPPSKAAVASELEVEMLTDPPPLVPEETVPDSPSLADVGSHGGARAPAARGTASLAAAATEADAEPATVAEAPGEDVTEVGPAAPGASAGSSPLSLAQLGVGDRNPFLVRSEPAVPHVDKASPADKAARVKRRLDRELAQGLLSQDTASGRGAGSPVMRSLEAAVYSSTAPLNGNASFIFIIDGDGKLLSSSVGSASGDREAWVRVARKAAQALAQRKLSVPKGKSVRLTVAVSSHLEMPSGADPGVAVDVLGMPLKRGGGARSTKVDLLNPLNPLAPLSLMGDPADIGQKARRMVRAHVVSEELL